MMKIIFLIVAVAFVGIIALSGFLFWQQFQGVAPVILPAPENIADIIDDTPKETQNSTDFPLQLPDGFSISVFARDLGPARVMTQDPQGNLIVSITKQGKIIALPDKNQDNVADQVVTVIDGLNRPHGLLFWNNKLYIAESDQVAIYDYDSINLRVSNKQKIIDLPNGENHFTRTLHRTPDDRLLISVGSSCNVCQEQDWRRATILVSDENGNDLKAFATGLRNAVFFETHPVTGDIWVTEMGRDLLGDDIPPDEINIVKEGGFYGWPICYGKNIHDTDFDKNTYIRNPCDESFGEIPSYIDLQAHSAPLGLAFVPEEGWPEEYWYDLLVAYHGSWNRTEPTGYKIMRFKLDEHGNYLGREDFISGWLQGNRALGRPVDILIQPGGVMYISDDKAGIIYRVTYNAN